MAVDYPVKITFSTDKSSLKRAEKEAKDIGSSAGDGFVNVLNKEIKSLTELRNKSSSLGEIKKLNKEINKKESEKKSLTDTKESSAFAGGFLGGFTGGAVWDLVKSLDSVSGFLKVITSLLNSLIAPFIPILVGLLKPFLSLFLLVGGLLFKWLSSFVTGFNVPGSNKLPEDTTALNIDLPGGLKNPLSPIQDLFDSVNNQTPITKEKSNEFFTKMNDVFIKNSAYTDITGKNSKDSMFKLYDLGTQIGNSSVITKNTFNSAFNALNNLAVFLNNKTMAVTGKKSSLSNPFTMMSQNDLQKQIENAKTFNYLTTGVKVNDAILSGGQVIQTNPKDYLIATKDPSSLGSGNVTINITVQGSADRTIIDEIARRLQRELRLKGAF